MIGFREPDGSCTGCTPICPKPRKPCEPPCCTNLQIPVGNPVLLAPKSIRAPCACLPPPVVPIVPNVIDLPINCPPRGWKTVPDFVPPLPPCIPIPPMRMAAMPLSKYGSCDSCCSPCCGPLQM